MDSYCSPVLKPATLLLGSSKQFLYVAVNCMSTPACISHCWLSVFLTLLHGKTCLSFTNLYSNLAIKHATIVPPDLPVLAVSLNTMQLGIFLKSLRLRNLPHTLIKTEQDALFPVRMGSKLHYYPLII